MESILLLIEELDAISKNIVTIDVLLRNGNVVSAYRQAAQSLELLKEPEKRKTMGRALLRMRKGEQIDALNDLKSLYDLNKNEKKKILIKYLKNNE